MLNCKECGGKKWFAKLDKKTGLQLKHHVKQDDGTEFDLRIWRCWRCGSTQEEVQPFVPLGYRTGANILYIDLEVSKSKFYSYGASVPSGYLNIDDLIHPYFIICWSASYVGSGRVWSDCVTRKEVMSWHKGKSPDARILVRLRELMASADLLAGHNVDRYDVRRCNTRFLLNGLEPVTDKKTHDTLKIARSKFAFESNKLDYISKVLGLRPKDDIRNSDWLRIVNTGDEKTLKKVLKYNRGDVKSGIGVLQKLMKYSGKKVWYGGVTLESPQNWLKA